MNKISFLDELVKLGAVRGLLKRSSSSTSEDVPHGMMSSDPTPYEIRVNPSDVTTRLPETAHLPGVGESGNLGRQTEPKDSIDRFKYNRQYRDRR